MGATHKRSCTRRVYLVKSVLVIGSNGQLGSELVKTFIRDDWKVISISHEQMPVENAELVNALLKANKVDWVINTAAFHKLDECEKDIPKSYLINSYGASNVARVASDLGMRSVFISSDYVFSGEVDERSSYKESDQASPINVYGHSKLAGEIATLASNPNNVVVRISSVFGSTGSSGKGGNFIESILKKARNHDDLKVIDDIRMSPTYAVDAALTILRALNQDYSGVLHAANANSASWFELATVSLQLAGIPAQIDRSCTNWDGVPRRPKNSTLDVSLAATLTSNTPPWQDAVLRYLKEKRHI